MPPRSRRRDWLFGSRFETAGPRISSRTSGLCSQLLRRGTSVVVGPPGHTDHRRRAEAVGPIVTAGRSSAVRTRSDTAGRSTFPLALLGNRLTVSTRLGTM